MAYFPHAFRKTFPASPTGAATAIHYPTASRATWDLTAGQIGLVTASTNLTLGATPGTTGNQVVYIAQGSYHSSDTIGSTLHGGYLESVKSKGINRSYINDMWMVTPSAPVANVIYVGWDGTDAETACCPTAVCDTTYYLRVDVKGSPALRFLSHNAYIVLDAYTGCCTDAPGTAVDPRIVLVDWAKQWNTDPIMSKFGVMSVHDVDTTVSPDVLDTAIDLDAFTPETNAATIATICATLKLTGAYVDTVFGDCSFQPSDFFQKEPIKFIASVLDETGNPCNTNYCVTEITAPKQGQGFGETVIRDFILDSRYRQEPFYNDPRMREITNDVTFTAVSRDSYYKHFYILHSVPRKSNPSGTFDSDQYLIDVAFKTVESDGSTAFAAGVTAAASFKTQLESWSGLTFTDLS